MLCKSNSMVCALFVLDPRAQWEIIKSPIANRLHRNLTSAGFSASSVEKYHYPSRLSWPPSGATRVSSYKFYRSLPYRKGHGALTARLPIHHRHSVGNVFDECVFNFQGANLKRNYLSPSSGSQRECRFYDMGRRYFFNLDNFLEITD